MFLDFVVDWLDDGLLQPEFKMLNVIFKFDDFEKLAFSVNYVK